MESRFWSIEKLSMIIVKRRNGRVSLNERRLKKKRRAFSQAATRLTLRRGKIFRSGLLIMSFLHTGQVPSWLCPDRTNATGSLQKSITCLLSEPSNLRKDSEERRTQAMGRQSIVVFSKVYTSRKRRKT